MNQFVGTKENGTTFLALRLEPGNVHRLTHNDPIILRVHDLFPDGIPQKLELVIGYSETPVTDARTASKDIKPKRPHCPECHSTVEELGVWRNESPMALTFCPVCGCIFGMVPGEVARTLPPQKGK